MFLKHEGKKITIQWSAQNVRAMNLWLSHEWTLLWFFESSPILNLVWITIIYYCFMTSSKSKSMLCIVKILSSTSYKHKFYFFVEWLCNDNYDLIFVVTIELQSMLHIIHNQLLTAGSFILEFYTNIKS